MRTGCDEFNEQCSYRKSFFINKDEYSAATPPLNQSTPRTVPERIETFKAPD
jgi:hypothetical protein